METLVGSNQNGSSQQEGLIKDSSDAEFVADVIEASKEIPIIVDFWAPWCGPCKQLTPLLENVVNKKNGKVILIKINIDENQEIATQLNIQSIPTVYCFVAGKPFDAFQGVQAESKIESMVDKLIDTLFQIHGSAALSSN